MLFRSSRLAGRGVLQHHPRKGWIVTPVNLQDLEEYIEIREALEITALKRSFHLLKQDVLMSIRNGNVPGSSPRLDNSLHQYIVATSNNKYIADFFERYGLFFSILMDHAAPETQLVSEMASQHNCIIESILANDLESAITHLRDHIRSQIPIVTKLMQPKHFEDSNSTHDTD